MHEIESKNSRLCPAVPAAKLAAVTKKKLSIEEVLFSQPSDENLIRQLYNQYLLKIEQLYQASDEGNHDDWLAPHKQQIDAFRDKVRKRLTDIRGDPVTPSSSASAAGSLLSNESSSSSARVRLAEKKAKAAAERKLIERTTEIDKKEIELKREQLLQEEKLKYLQLERKRAEIESEELENEILERELDDIDGSIASDRSSKCCVRNLKFRDQCVGNAEEQNQELVRVLKRQNEISEKLSIQNEQSTLPKQELQCFNGDDVTEYKIFKQKFERLIEKKCTNDSDKLCYLEQYTAGAVQNLVKSCAGLDPGNAFREAKLLLEKEFNNEYKVAAAYLKTLSEWPVIKGEDCIALENLHTYLLKCKNHFGDSSPGNHINNPKEIMNIVLKLPYKMREGWRRLAYKLQEKSQPAQFHHLVNFVGKEVSILKQPLFGSISDPRDSPAVFSDKIKRNFTTNVTISEETACPCCKKDNHSLFHCIFFKSKTYDEKTDFVKKSRLCFSCLAKDHSYKFCTKKIICQKCNRKHPTIMHNDEWTSSSRRGSTDSSDAGKND